MNSTIQDHGRSLPQAQSSNAQVGPLAEIASPELEPSSVQMASAAQQQDQDFNANRRARESRVFEPETILANGGLEGALLVLMVERGKLFESTLNSKINDTSSTHVRMRQKAEERVEAMEGAQKEAKKASKIGKISSHVGWAVFALGGVATALSLGALSPLIAAGAVLGTALNGYLQYEGAAQGPLTKKIGEKAMFFIGLGVGIGSFLLMGGVSVFRSFKDAAQKTTQSAISGLNVSQRAGRAVSEGAKTSANSSQLAASGGQSGSQNLLRSGTRVAGSASDDALQAQTSTAAASARNAGGNTAHSAGGAHNAPPSTATTTTRNAAQNTRGASADQSAAAQEILKKSDQQRQVNKLASQINSGDHPLQKAAAASVAISGSGKALLDVRAAVSERRSTNFSADATQARAKEKRLSVYLDYTKVSIEEISDYLQKGNRTLSRQLQMIMEPKIAISEALNV